LSGAGVLLVTNNQCCQVCDFPAELGYFNTVAAGCFSCPWVEATPNNMIFSPWNANFTRRTLPKTRILPPGTGSNWAGFVVKTGNPANNQLLLVYTTRIPEMLGRFLNLNKMKTKRLSNHMSQYFIHNRT